MGIGQALMAVKVLPKILVKNFHKLAFATKKASPQILVVSGVVITGAAFTWGIINATKLNKTLDETKTNVELIEAKKNDISEDDKKSIQEWQKELNKAKADAIWRVFKLIGIPSIVFASGIAFIVGGHMILVRRFGELSVGFAALQSKFDKYRQLNIAEHGEECDRRYIQSVVNEKKVEAVIKDENGNVINATTAAVQNIDRNAGTSMYTFIFSEEFSRKWNRDTLMNLSFLKCQERYWNACLDSGKVVILKNVLDDLGIELDPDDPANDYTMIAGWRPNGDGDRKVDFGIMREINKPAIDLDENIIFLNFNCDGNLYHSTRYTKDGRKVC